MSAICYFIATETLIMKELLDKISSYNIFNFLFPGIVFAIFSKALIGYNFIQSDILINAFLFYFMGMIISRIGSLIIEPILKKISFIKFVEYKKYVEASKKDAKIEILLEANNTYRTILSSTILLGILKIYAVLETKCQFLKANSYYILLVSIFLIFLFSYKKQTKYVVKRVEASS